MAESKTESGLSHRSVAELEAMREVAENTGFSKGHSLAHIVEALNRQDVIRPDNLVDENIALFKRLRAFKERIRKGVAVSRAGK